MTDRFTVGLIGLGLVGKALAQRLHATGYSVAGYDIAPAARDAAAALGVEVQPDAVAVARRSRILLLSLLTSENRRELFWGSQRLAYALTPGMTILDTTTGRPEDIRADHDRLAGQEVRLVDVCLSGSSQVIAEHRALALVGDEAEKADYAPLLEAIAKRHFFFDAPGQGNCVKLIVNLVFGLHRLVLAEALGLAARDGFDLATLLEVLREGETYSTVMDTKGPKMIAGQYTPAVARLGQHAKDVGLILEYAQRVGAPVPVSEVHARLIQAACEMGAGDWDNAAIFEAYRPRDEDGG